MEIVKFVSKPWGYEKWIHNDERYCGKILFIAKGHFTSWHYHKLKYETMYLLSGHVVLRYAYEDMLPNSNMKVHFIGTDNDWINGSSLINITHLVPDTLYEIKPGMRHRLTALQDSTIIEFSTQHFDEDSIRLVMGE